MTFILISSALLLLAVSYYFMTAAKKPTLIYQATELNQAIVNNTQALTKRYFPTP